MDDDMRTAFTALGTQVDGVEKRLRIDIEGVETRVNNRIDGVQREFHAFKRATLGATDPPTGGAHVDIANASGVDAAALSILNGGKPPPSLKERVAGAEDAVAKLNRILALQEGQSREQGTGESFFAYLKSRSGRKLALQVITAVLVLTGYIEGRMHRELPAASSTPAASSR